jgi:hypothetical protein
MWSTAKSECFGYPQIYQFCCFALILLGTNDESFDVSSHLGWKNASASYHETKAFVDR